MMKTNDSQNRRGVTVLAGILLCGSAYSAGAQTPKAAPDKMAGAQPPLTISRANLAKSASFTVTQTLAPKGGEKIVRTYTVEVKGDKARMDYSDPSFGTVRYVANEKGIFFYIPTNKSAMKQTLQGGVEGALKVAFAQYATQLASAKKVGTAVVSAQPTTIYKDDSSGAVIYVGTKPGFRLPVKAVIENEGGASTFLVSNIRLNVPLKDERFALPPGTQIIDSNTAPGVPVATP